MATSSSTHKERSCKVGKTKRHGRCVKRCPSARSAKTGRCLKKCKTGKKRNSETRRCRKVK